MNSIRIAMWSGPRTISTAMMRSFGNRPDCFVCDEPRYAHYLDQTRLPHPGMEEVIASQPTDWREVVAWLTGPIPRREDGVVPGVWYQKHMCHHMLPVIELDWLKHLKNCFLIREPREMITSLIHFIPEPTLEDTGLPQQVRLYDWVRENVDSNPPVIDSKDVLLNPRRILEQLCDAVGIAFTDAMLKWPPGIRETDGVWAKYWYKKVEPTTGFGTYKPKNDPVPESMLGLLDECNTLYERMAGRRITA